MILQGTSYNEEEADKNRPQKRDRLFHFKDLSAGKTTKGGLDFEQKKKKQGGIFSGNPASAFCHARFLEVCLQPPPGRRVSRISCLQLRHA